MKKTAVAPSNIAFIKYWGRKDEALRLPENGSISMNLSSLLTTTTVEFNKAFKEDMIILRHSGNQAKPEHPESLMTARDAGQARLADAMAKRASKTDSERVLKHLDRIRSLVRIHPSTPPCTRRCGAPLRAKVVSKNNFPTGTGLSSSASGFAALTLAASKAAGLDLSEKELSILARQGSGSACRSIPDGFVEWFDGDTSDTSYAVSIYPNDYWDIADIVVVVSKDKKEVSTTEGQKLAKSSPFFRVRLENIREKINLMKQYIKEKNFTELGELVEQEALELHAIMFTSRPSLIYWLPGTLKIMYAVRKWRQEGLQVYFTLNTGQDIHLICQKKDVKKLVKKTEAISDVQKTIINFSDKGARIVPEDLF